MAAAVLTPLGWAASLAVTRSSDHLLCSLNERANLCGHTKLVCAVCKDGLLQQKTELSTALQGATASSKHQSLIMRSRSLARSVSSKICSKLETSTARSGSEHHNHHAPTVVYQTITILTHSTSGSHCAHTTRSGCFHSGHQGSHHSPPVL